MQLVRALSDAPDGRPMHWRTVGTIGTALGLAQPAADDAIAFAVARDWLLTEGQPPHRHTWSHMPARVAVARREAITNEAFVWRSSRVAMVFGTTPAARA